jgi:hypothetical protein
MAMKGTPMRLTNTGASEVAMFGRILETGQADLHPEAARAILTLGFAPVDRERMRELSAKAQEGTLTPAEKVEIDNYERVGHMLSLMKSKARRALATMTAIEQAI